MSKVIKLRGIDISHHQGDANIDVSKFDKVDFVIIKASQGDSYADPKMTSIYDNAIKAKKLIGFYHFADGKSSGEKEAKWFLKTIKKYIGKGVLVLDWEADALKKGVSYAKEFSDTVYNETGIKPIIYMSTSTVKDYKWDSYAKKYPYLWGANYGKDPKIEGFLTISKIPNIDINTSPFEEIIRQYSSNTYLEGFKNQLDADVAFITKTAFKALYKAEEKKESNTKKETNSKKESNTKKETNNKKETTKDTKKDTTTYTIDSVAKLIIKGKSPWNITGSARTEKIKDAGLDPALVQVRVNQLLNPSSYYTVKNGDTAKSISKSKNVTTIRLKKLNTHIKDINKLKAGDILRIK